MALDAKQGGNFEGNDGTAFNAGRAFVWDRDGKRMGLNTMKKGDSAASVAKIPKRLYGLSDLPVASAKPETLKQDVQRFPDLHEAPELQVLSGDKYAQWSTFPQAAAIENQMGVRLDSVGVVGIGPKGGFRRVKATDTNYMNMEVADGELTGLVSRDALKLAVAIGERAIGVSRQGRVEGKGGRTKGTAAKKATPADAGAEASM